MDDAAGWKVGAYGEAQAKAEKQAREINKFWGRFGVNAGAFAVKAPFWTVKSKMVNGLPPGKNWSGKDLSRVVDAVDMATAPVDI